MKITILCLMIVIFGLFFALTIKTIKINKLNFHISILKAEVESLKLELGNGVKIKVDGKTIYGNEIPSEVIEALEKIIYYYSNPPAQHSKKKNRQPSQLTRHGRSDD